jgi:PAT family beta-lactamase induction signal transducer AmpG
VDSLVSSSRGRRFLFFILYLSEGGPIGLLWWALPAHLRMLGLPLPSITLLTSFLVVPWTLKFLWAPVIDASRSRGVPLRIWIGSAQVAMAATLLPLLVLDPREEFVSVVLTLLLHAVAAATQDAAIDAYAIRTVEASERGTINAFMQAGMLLGRGAFGGSTLILISVLGFGGAVGALTLTLLLIATWVLRSSDAPSHAPSGNRGDVRTTLRHTARMLRDRAARAGFIVALLAGAGFEGVGAVGGPYLVDRGYDASTIGMLFAFGTTPAMLLGVFLGGRWADRQSRAAVARASVILLAALIVLLAVADPWSAPGGGLRLLLLTVLYLAIGIFTASSYALFMDLTDPQIGATQFSAYMAGTNLCEAWSAFAVGRFAAIVGYPIAFGLLAAASLASLPSFGVIRARFGTARQAGGPSQVAV